VEARGSSLPPEALDVLYAVFWVIGHAPGERRVVETHCLRPEFEKDKEKALRRMMMVRQLDVIDVARIRAMRDSMARWGTIDKIPAHAKLTTLPAVDSDDEEPPEEEMQVPLADVYLTPVRAEMEKIGSTQMVTKVYWLIIVRTRRNYDFTGHIQDIYEHYMKQVKVPGEKKRAFDHTGDALENIRKAILLLWKWSPSARAYLKQNKITQQEPWIYFNPRVNTPVSMEVAGSIHEVVRGMMHPPCVDGEDGT